MASGGMLGVFHVAISSTPRQDIVLQSIGGSLRLPLLQNGACPLPCTPLLSVLMLVTPTDREVLTIVPGVRLMAVSLYGLEMARVGIPSMPTERLSGNS